MTTAPDISLLAARDLRIDRGGQCLIDGLNFALGRGDLLVLRGANGSGKTSLLRTLAGIALPTAGSVVAASVAQTDEPAAFAASVAYWGHRDGLKDNQSAIDVLRQWQALAGSRLSQADAAALLERVGLGARQTFPVRTFSAGQRRRLAFARLLAREAPVWLLDEPFTALDGEGREMVAAAMAQHREKGGCIVAALHEEFSAEGAKTLRLGVAQADEAA